MQRRTFLSAAMGAGVGSLGGIGALTAKLTGSPAPAAGAIVRGDATPDGRRLYAGADLAFGTTIGVRLLHRDERTAELAIADAIGQARRIDALMSLYRDDSQVAELNRRGVLHQPDPDLVTVLKKARELSQLTGGAFDITVQPLWRTWSEAAARGALPADDARRAAMALVDWRRLAFDDRHVALLAPGMAITLNGIAQGYASDLALAAVKARGVTDALLDTGEFAAEGEKAAHRPWVVGVRDPRRADAFSGLLPMQGRCVATSGDYETTFTPDFVHHHILDPMTGDSPPALASVTVVAPTGLDADGLSTALMVLGPKKAMALAAKLDHVDVLLVAKNGSTWRSRNLPSMTA